MALIRPHFLLAPFPAHSSLQRRIPIVLSQLAPVIAGGKVQTTALALPSRPGFIQCYSPSTLTFLAEIRAHTAEDVRAIVARARFHQLDWVRSLN